MDHIYHSIKNTRVQKNPALSSLKKEKMMR